MRSIKNIFSLQSLDFSLTFTFHVHNTLSPLRRDFKALSFSFLLNNLNLASFPIASLLFLALHFLINLTGNRLRVYFPPLPAWCDFTRLAKSFVQPV